MSDFKVGDVVQLKCGGQEMVVVSADPGLEVGCRWFKGKKCETDSFPAEALFYVPSSFWNKSSDK